MKDKKCPLCGSTLDASNDNRCKRFPICAYQDYADKGLNSFIMYDLETTGLSKQDHIIEIGALFIENNKVKDSFSTLCNPGVFISQRITEITNITNNMLRDQIPESQAVQEFVDWVNKKEIDICVGHNIDRFDNKVLDNAVKRYKVSFPFNRTLDTLKIAQSLNLKEQGIENYKQETLAKFYGVSYEAHRAVNDVKALFEIFKKMGESITEFPIINI